MVLEFGPLRPLHPGDVRYLVIHSAGARDNSDQSAADIHAFHAASPAAGGRGWSGIGYHYVIRRGGGIERGRPNDRVGAHVRGANDFSLGICCSGNGDIEDFSAAQLEALVRLLRELQRDFPAAAIVGHRELVDMLIADGKFSPAYATDKTCPGRRVDLERIRERVKR